MGAYLSLELCDVYLVLDCDSNWLVLELRTGQLVKDEYFTLFEAVGALEVCALSCL